jgi:hypothetical protein
VAEQARERVFVHAGVVGWRGKAILLPGRSYTGKSTLVEALVGAGAEYYSDEYALLDEEGRVHPFRRALCLRAREGGEARRIAPAALGVTEAGPPLPVALIAACRYREGTRGRLRTLGPAETLRELFANSVAARSAPERVLEVLRQTVRGTRGVSGTRPEARQFAATLFRLAEDEQTSRGPRRKS